VAVFAFTDGSCVFNGVEISPFCKSIELTIEGADLDTTGMGTTNNSFHTRIIGLKDWKVSLELMNDFAAGQVDATFMPDLISGTARTVTLKPTSSSVGATNPRYFGSVLVTSGSPIAGGVGDLAMNKVELVAAGALTRATT
jgi:hypothetical protein